MSRQEGTKVSQEARRSQVGSGRHGIVDAGSHVQDVRGRRNSRSQRQSRWLWQQANRRTRQSCASRQGQTPAHESRRSQFVSGRQGTADAGSHEQDGGHKNCEGSHTQSSWLWQAGNLIRRQSCAGRQRQASAQEARRSQVGSGRQRNAHPGSNEQDGRGRRLRRNPDTVKLALAGMELQTQTGISKLAAADIAQEARHSLVGSSRQGTAEAQSYAGRQGPMSAKEARRSQVGSGRQGTADAGSHEQARWGRSCAGSQTQTSYLWKAGKCSRGKT
jgi:hypothetical protein